MALARSARTTEVPRITAARRAARGPGVGTRADCKPTQGNHGTICGLHEWLARRSFRPPGTSCPRRRMRVDTERAFARHGKRLRNYRPASLAETVPRCFQQNHRFPANKFHSMRIIPNPRDLTPCFRALFRVGASRFRVGGGRTATEWRAGRRDAAHEPARGDAAIRPAARAQRGVSSPAVSVVRGIGACPHFNLRKVRA